MCQLLSTAVRLCHNRRHRGGLSAGACNGRAQGAASAAALTNTGSAMSISLSGRPRDRFKVDLQAHRETFSLDDGEYADQVLKVSLNTYKKCVQANGPLALKRHTFVNIFANTALDPRTMALRLASRARSRRSADTRRRLKFLCGRFFLYDALS